MSAGGIQGWSQSGGTETTWVGALGGVLQVSDPFLDRYSLVPRRWFHAAVPRRWFHPAGSGGISVLGLWPTITTCGVGGRVPPVWLF